MKYIQPELIISIISASLISLIHFYYIQYDKHHLTFVQYSKIYFKIFIINILVMYGLLYMNKVIFIDKLPLPIFDSISLNSVSAKTVLPDVIPTVLPDVIPTVLPDVIPTVLPDVIPEVIQVAQSVISTPEDILNNIEISHPPF